MNRSLVLLLVLGLGAAPAAYAYKEVPPPEKVVLPPAKSPAESMAAIKIPAGFELELVAAEPMVMDPTDVAWGPDGRLWVIEMADYPAGIDGQGKPGGRIRFLESTKSDGVYDKSTLFADGLNFPTSAVPWRDGVLVSGAPDLLFLRDTDGDGRADRTEKLFTGFGEGNQQHRVNGLQWGLDGWLHMANGNSGGKVSSSKSAAVVDIGQRDFRISIEDGRIELLAGQSQVGRNRDDWGNWFGCNNSNPIWHYALQEHYLRRNPHLVAPSSTVTVSSTPGAAPVYPVSQTLARFNDPQGFNHITSACGVMIYRDELLGPDVAGNVFVCEPVHNLVHREVVRPSGVTFASQRAPGEQTSEFFASADHWSRFVAARTGPDGALYIVDMYRLVIEHPKWIPDAWQKQLGNLRAGDDQGRIYRVRRKGLALRSVPRLDRADAAGLVAALDTPNGTVRDLAQQQLVWRRDKSAVPALTLMALESKRPEARLQALTTLDLMGVVTPAVVERALRDAHPGVRRHAVRVSERFAGTAPSLLAGVVERAEDPDAMVRQQAAYTLGEWRQPAAATALAKLLRPDEDRFIRTAAMSSALPHAEALIAQLGATAAPDDPALIDLVVATNNVKALGRVLSAIAKAAEGTEWTKQFKALARVLDGLQRNNTSLTQLHPDGTAGSNDVLGGADGVFVTGRKVAGDRSGAVSERIAAVQILGRGRTRQTEDVQQLIALLTPQSPIELQLAVVSTLGRMNKPTIPTRLLAGWNGYGRAVRTAVLDLVMSRANWANLLLDQVESDASMRAEIDAGRRLALVQHSNAALATRAATIFNQGVDANRQKVIDQYLAAVKSLNGDPRKGAEVFTATCSACHKFGDVPGRLIGPDIAAVKDRTPDYLVTHILDPNRAVEDRYVLFSASTQDGRTLAGMLTGESGNSITFLGLDGAEQVILRSELRSLSSTSRSLMPDGLEGAIPEQAMADLIVFLAGARAGQ
ncbi:MAG: HEAT repeat domain-containing protein [Opitutaceae bacterium]|nr:HEAT repeat domain-containing protein [Opitutaceae bacterium]